MNKKIISFVLSVVMVFCLIPACFAADNDSMINVISKDDFTKNPDVNFPYWDNPSTEYLNGEVWGAQYPFIDNRIQRTNGVGWELIQNKEGNTQYGAIETYKKAFCGKTVLSKSGLKSIVHFSTGKKTEINFKARFVMAGETIFEYASQTGELNIGAPGDANRTIQLDEGCEYRIETLYAYNKSAGVYGVFHKLYKADDEENFVLSDERNFADCSEYFTDAKAAVEADDKIGLELEWNAGYSKDETTTYLTLYDIEIDNIVYGDIIDIGDIKYSDTGVSFEESGTDFVVPAGKYNEGWDINYKPSEDPEWLAGNCWGSDDVLYGTNKTGFEEGYLWIKTRVDGGEGGWPAMAETWHGRLVHHFMPLKDSDNLYFTADVKFPKLGSLVDDNNTADRGYGGMLSLTSLDGANSLNIFDYFFKPYQGYRFRMGGINCELAANEGYTIAPTVSWGLPVFEDSAGNSVDVLSLRVTLTPSKTDATKYEVNITLENPAKDYETVFETVDSIVIDKDFAESLCTLEIMTNREGVFTNGNTQRIFGLKNLKIETRNNAKEMAGLTSDTTSLYVPYNNITKHNFGAVVCAAVTDKTTGIQKDFYTESYGNDGVMPYRGNFKIDLNITDASKEYVKVFVFDSFDKLSPLSLPKTTN